MPGTAEVKLLLDPQSLFSKRKAEKLNIHMSQKRGMAYIINHVYQAHWPFPGLHSQDAFTQQTVTSGI